MVVTFILLNMSCLTSSFLSSLFSYFKASSQRILMQ
jgi:hypothetical protein